MAVGNVSNPLIRRRTGETVNSSLLLDEKPLIILPAFATTVGLGEAVFVQQLHFLTRQGKSGKVVDGRRWIYNTPREWVRQYFPFWSVHTVERIIKSCKGQKIIDVRSDLNSHPSIRTNWYAVRYDTIYVRNGTSIRAEWESQSGGMLPAKMAECNKESETLTETLRQRENNVAASGTTSAKRGSRLPEVFAVTDAHRVFARDHGLPDPEGEIEKFCDYWRAQSGRQAVKADWDATFRNWLRRAAEYNNRRNGYGKQQQRNNGVRDDRTLDRFTRDVPGAIVST